MEGKTVTEAGDKKGLAVLQRQAPFGHPRLKRRREEDPTEDDVGEEQGPEDVESLGDQEGNCGFPAAYGHQVFKLRFETDAEEGQREEPASDTCRHSGDRFRRCL